MLGVERIVAAVGGRPKGDLVIFVPAGRSPVVVVDPGWSSRIDRSQPILLGDAAQDAERVRIYKYREADGAVTRLNATLEEPFGQWRLVNDSAAAIDRERNLANPFFSPTVSETCW